MSKHKQNPAPASDLPTNQEKNQSEKGEPQTTSAQDFADALAAKDKQVQELTEQLQRLQAEFANYRKRTEADAALAAEKGQEKFLRDLLSVADSVMLALKHDVASEKPAKAEADLRVGLNLIKDQFNQLLERFGVETVDCTGTVDPRLHEVYLTETTKDAPNGAILEVLQQGYQRRGSVLRTAKVKAARNG